jgi:hypothetical protein
MSNAKNEEKPWDDWQIDRSFLESLDTWTKQHQENKLDRFLDTLIGVIDSGKDVLDLIPDTPFPVGQLCKGLRMLILLANVSSPFLMLVLNETIEHDAQDVRLAQSRVRLFLRIIISSMPIFDSAQDPYIHPKHHSMGRSDFGRVSAT